MEIKAKLAAISRDILSGDYMITLSAHSFPRGLGDLKGDLRISLKPWRERRSLDANAMLWACLGDLGKALERDPWDLYLEALQQYGKYVYITIEKQALPAMQAQWRETMVVGETVKDGTEFVQLLCFFGSSTYDSAEFSRLLNGVIRDMEDAGLPAPPDGDIVRALKRLEKK